MPGASLQVEHDKQVERTPPMSLDPGRVMGSALTPGDDIDDGGVKAFEDPCMPSRTQVISHSHELSAHICYMHAYHCWTAFR